MPDAIFVANPIRGVRAAVVFDACSKVACRLEKQRGGEVVGPMLIVQLGAAVNRIPFRHGLTTPDSGVITVADQSLKYDLKLWVS